MNVGILGTGKLAAALGRAWAAAGHHLVLTGHDPERAAGAAERIGPAATAVAPADFAERADVVVVAVSWERLTDAVRQVGPLAGKTVIDCTNAVDYATGRLKPPSGSAAQTVASAAPGAHVVKALHLFAGDSWPYRGPLTAAPVVAICGDDPTAIASATALITDLGGRAAVVGTLDSARQLEEAAGFVMRVVAAGHNPRFAVPDVEPAPVA